MMWCQNHVQSLWQQLGSHIGNGDRINPKPDPVFRHLLFSLLVTKNSPARCWGRKQNSLNMAWIWKRWICSLIWNENCLCNYRCSPMRTISQYYFHDNCGVMICAAPKSVTSNRNVLSHTHWPCLQKGHNIVPKEPNWNPKITHNTAYDKVKQKGHNTVPMELNWNPQITHNTAYDKVKQKPRNSARPL